MTVTAIERPSAGQRCLGCPGGMDCILPRCIVLPEMPLPPFPPAEDDLLPGASR